MGNRVIGVIGGSGIYDLDGLRDLEEIAVDTPFGAPSDRLIRGRLGDASVVFLSRHGRGHRMHPHEVNYRANLFAFKTLGVQWVISLSAVGSMRVDIRPGDLVVVDQYIDRTHGRASTFFGDGIVAHVSFGDPVSPVLSDILHQAATERVAAGGAGERVHRGGTYLCINGPQFSTRAESNVYRKFGVDVIGMTAMPEAKLAREAEMSYATLALSTDYDCWHESEEEVSVEAVVAIVKKNARLAREVVGLAVERIPERHECIAANALRGAIMTDLAHIPAETRRRLEPLIGQAFVVTGNSLLVVGSVAVDDIDGPYGWQRDQLGGSASFIAVAASYFTDQAAVVAVVGDEFDPAHIDLFRDRGIDVSGIERQPGKTFRWVGRYAADLATRETLDTQLGVFAEFRPRLTDAHRAAELVFLGNIDPVLQLEVVEQVKRPILIAADTMNFWINGHREALLATLHRVHLLIINDEEARQLAGEHNLVRAAAAIRRLGPHSVVVKRGDAGALLFHEGGIFAAPALPLAEVRDPTGAGDAFAGGFMGYLARAGRFDATTVRTAMIYGSVMGSFSVEQFSLDGLRNLTPALIQARFDAFHDLTRFERLSLS